MEHVEFELTPAQIHIPAGTSPRTEIPVVRIAVRRFDLEGLIEVLPLAARGVYMELEFKTQGRCPELPPLHPRATVEPEPETPASGGPLTAQPRP